MSNLKVIRAIGEGSSEIIWLPLQSVPQVNLNKVTENETIFGIKLEIYNVYGSCLRIYGDNSRMKVHISEMLSF